VRSARTRLTLSMARTPLPGSGERCGPFRGNLTRRSAAWLMPSRLRRSSLKPWLATLCKGPSVKETPADLAFAGFQLVRTRRRLQRLRPTKPTNPPKESLNCFAVDDAWGSHATEKAATPAAGSARPHGDAPLTPPLGPIPTSLKVLSMKLKISLLLHLRDLTEEPRNIVFFDDARP